MHETVCVLQEPSRSAVRYIGGVKEGRTFDR
jgi:hypothetical protein